MLIAPDGTDGEHLLSESQSIDAQRRIAKSTVVIADNIAEYLSQDPTKMWQFRDFPNALPPFESLFVEYESQCEYMKQVGVLFETQEITKEMRATKLVAEDDRWLVGMWMFAAINGQASMFDDELLLTMNEQGSITGGLGLSGTTSLWGPASLPAVLAICFMNCKRQVKISEKSDSEPSVKWTNRTKTPRFRYHVLDINPMKEVLRTEGQSDATGLKKALHICRGHFCTYTEEKPLFGTYVGTVWKPSHVRGDIKSGAVIKDYSVSPQINN